MALKATRTTGPLAPPLFVVAKHYSTYRTYTTSDFSPAGSDATGASLAILNAASFTFEVDR
jgi:hypothetical protein